VHYSDLNKAVNRIPLYILVQYLEYTIWDRIDERVNERVVRQLFGDDSRGIIASHKRAAAHNVHIGWAGAFNFSSILRLGRFFNVVDLDDEQIEALKEARNKAAHSDQNLVNDYADVHRLVEAYRLASKLLEDL